MKKNIMQEKDYKWFCDNIKILFDEYGYAYVAIKNKKVLGTYTSVIDGINDMKKKKEKLGTFIIQKCAPDNKENLLNFTSVNFR